MSRARQCAISASLTVVVRCVVLASLPSLTSCVPYGTRLAHMNDEGRSQEVAEDASRWLVRHADERSAAEWHAVQYQRVRAALAIARTADTPVAYAAFRREFGQLSGVADLLDAARELHATAAYRDDVRPSNSIERIRSFRQTFDGTEAARRAQLDEMRLALADAMRANTSAAFQRFRDTYEGVEGADEYIESALREEVEIELASVRASPSIERWRRIRSDYGAYESVRDLVGIAIRSEAELAYGRALTTRTERAFHVFVQQYEPFPEAGTWVEQARTRELEVGLEAAVATHRLDALEQFRAAHSTPPWGENASRAIGALVLEPLTREDAEQVAGSHDDVDRFEESVIDHATEVQLARPDEATVLRVAESRRASTTWRMFLIVYPDSAQRALATERFRQSLWAEATALRSTAAYLRFFRFFPEDERLAEADLALRSGRERERVRRRGYHVDIQRTATSATQSELTFTVRDCADRPVIGLRSASIRVLDGPTVRPLTGFLGMDDERPLSVEIALDLSGSMAMEQAAVRSSIVQFVETMHLRGRDTQVGLIGYADRVLAEQGFSSQPAEFARWMDRLPPPRPGFAEDGVGALARAATALGRETGERVVVLLSDEPLQLNASGGREFGIADDCVRVMSASVCSGQCTSEGCFTGCWNRLGAPAQTWMRQCHARGGGQFCVVTAIGFVRGFAAECSSAGAGAVMQPLAERLASAAIRPFFVVSDSALGGEPFAAYRSLATRLGGEVREVPNDSVDPAPYEQALLGVADLLAQQYVAQVEGVTSSARPFEVVVRPPHEWERSRVVGDVYDASDVGGTVECPALVEVHSNRSLVRTVDCGSRFEELGITSADGILANSNDGRVASVLTSGRLAIVSGTSITYADAPGVDGYTHPTFDAQGRLWAIGRSSGGFRVVAFDPEGAAVFDWPIPVAGTGFVMVPTTRDPSVCVLTGSSTRHCRSLSGTEWEVRSTRGVASADIVSGVVLDTGYPLTLLSTRDGRLLRSSDRGSAFTEVLRSGNGSRVRVAAAPNAELICAGIGAVVKCSENDGVDWFEVGPPGESSREAAPFFVHSHLYAVRDSGVHVVRRIVTRELPGTAALFDTGSDRPKASADSMLRTIATVLADERTFRIRIEGHTDSRGDVTDNESLATRRAESIARRLREMGVDRSRMAVQSFGERHPIRNGNSSADHARNRRVEMIVAAPLPADGWYGSGCRP